MWRFMLLVPIAACVVGSGSAGEHPLDEALAILGPTPEAMGGCSDVIAYGHDADDTAGILVFVGGGLAETARTTGAVQIGSYVLPDDEVTVQVLVGQEISQQFCNDGGQGAVIDHQADAVSGRVDIEVDPQGVVGVTDITATVTLEDLLLEDPATGDERELPSLVLEDVPVGWYPG